MRSIETAFLAAVVPLGFGNELPVGDILQLGMVLVTRPRRPGVNHRAAPIRTHDANRNVKRRVQLKRKIDAHRGKTLALRQVLRRERLPDDRIRRHLARLARELVVGGIGETNKRLACHLGDQTPLTVAEMRIVANQGKLRVGLSAAIPDLTDENIGNRLGNLRLLGHRREDAPLLRGRHLRQTDAPRARLVRRRRHLVSGKHDPHLLTGIRRAPDGHFAIALKNHTVGKRARQSDLGQHARGKHQERGRHRNCDNLHK